MFNDKTLKELTNFAIDIRIQTMRQLAKRGFGHLGGSMSIADLLSVLYGLDMNYDPQNPAMENRDWLICSKGHAGPAIYAALALKGFFPMEWLDTLNQPGTNLPSHCDRLKTPGIDMTTGSLGQGISLAAGVALGSLYDGKNCTIYCIVGDGECQEGQVWEAIMFAGHRKLKNFVLFLDYNKMQLDGPVAEINNLGNMSEKFKAFGWSVSEVDGHNYEEIHLAIQNAKASPDKPNAIVLNTVKGKDCPFAMGKINHHVKVTEEEAKSTIAYLENLRSKLK